MPSFRQLLDRHATVLVLDASSTRIQVGHCSRHRTSCWRTAEAEAGIALFTCIRELGVEIPGVDAFAFCEGPGSILGIRTAAMAIRTWGALRARPVYAYGSLALVAHASADPKITVIADARREAWHEYTREFGLRRVAAGEVRSPAATPAGFRHWMPLPAGTAETPYDVRDLLDRAAETDLFRPVEAPDAFLHEEPAYVGWSPAVHQAPSR